MRGRVRGMFRERIRGKGRGKSGPVEHPLGLGASA